MYIVGKTGFPLVFSRKSSQLTLEHLWFVHFIHQRGETTGHCYWLWHLSIGRSMRSHLKQTSVENTKYRRVAWQVADHWHFSRRCGSTCWKVFFVIVHMRKLAVDGFMPPEIAPLYCTYAYTLGTSDTVSGIVQPPFFFLAGTQFVSFGFIPICTHVFWAQNQKICPKDYNSQTGITHPQDDSPFINLPVWWFKGMPKCARHLNPSPPL